MGHIRNLITEESDMFGPGTDLILCLSAVFLVMLVFGIKFNDDIQTKYDNLLKSHQKLKKDYSELVHDGGNFKASSHYFSTGHFESNPVTDLVNEVHTNNLVEKIITEYQAQKNKFPFLFIIGHANQIDDPNAREKSYESRLDRNWRYAGRRAVVIARLIQNFLTDGEKEKIIVVTTGEFDLLFPDRPYSQENARVEVVFGKEWKLPSAIQNLPVVE